MTLCAVNILSMSTPAVYAVCAAIFAIGVAGIAIVEAIPVKHDNEDEE